VGNVGRLRGELQHYAYRDIAEHMETIERYTTLAARQMFEQGRRASFLDVALHPRLAFLRNYVLKGGFHEGVPGLVISKMNAYYVFLKFAKLWEIEHEERKVPGSGFRVPGSGAGFPVAGSGAGFPVAGSGAGVPGSGSAGANEEHRNPQTLNPEP
jgi:hypothetical protein